jgi:general stress protein 26
MADPQELEAKFWKALKSDMTMMLGLNGIEDGHARPMIAQLETTQNAIWFFTATDNSIVQNLDDRAGRNRAIATFASKGHDLFATVHGSLKIDNNRDVIDRLWNRFVAAWYPGGKADPKLVLLRLDPERAEIWLNESSIFTGITLMLGSDPKKEYKENVATVSLR